MNPNPKSFRPPALAGAVAERTCLRAPRFAYGVKFGQPAVASNRAFIWDWAARRAKLVSAQARLSK